MGAGLYFASPALLLGAAAVVVPVVIHLLLRPRPRRVIFPPVEMLSSALAAGQRAQTLRNYRLLLARMALLALLAFLLAGPTCRPAAPTATGDEPTACVVIVDDSWSQRYQTDADRTPLDEQLEQAAELVRSARSWPQPSTVAVVWADPARPGCALLRDVDAALNALRPDAVRPPHARPLGAALRRAVELLQTARQPARRIVVFTDNARHAWRDVDPGLLTGLENLELLVRSARSEGRSNLAVVDVRGPRGLHPASAPIPLQVTVRSDGAPARCRLVVREGPRVVRRIDEVEVPAGASTDVSIVLPGRRPGVYGLTVAVEPDDRLGFDQRRYVVIQVGRKPRAWLLTASDQPADDLTALLVRNLLAPETLPSEQQRVELEVFTPAELAGAARQADLLTERRPDLIVMLSDLDLNAAARRLLRRAVEAGAAAVLLPGSRVAGQADWAPLRKLLSDQPPRVEQLDAVLSMTWTEPPAADGGLRELTRAAVRRRLLVAPAAGARVLAEYSDGKPAIVARALGRGRVLLLTSSPDPDWSELGVRAAGLLTWLHHLMRAALGPADRTASFLAGQVDQRPFAGLPARGRALVRRTDSPEPVPAESARLVDGRPADGWPTAQPGIYAVHAGPRRPAAALYTVNWPAEESDLTVASAERLAQLLGSGNVRLVSDDDSGTGPATTWWQRLLTDDPAAVLPLLLVGLVLLEMALAK